MAFRSCLFAVGVFVFVVADLSATSVRSVTFQEMVDRAERVFRGRVVAISSDWQGSTERGRTIRTRVTFDVERVFKGTLGLVTAFDFLGGRVGDVEFRVEGMPQFGVGEEVILFVQPSQAGSPLVGFMQGRFRVTRSIETGQAFVLTHDYQPFANPAMIGTPPPTFSVTPIVPMSLAGFEAAIIAQLSVR